MLKARALKPLLEALQGLVTAGYTRTSIERSSAAATNGAELAPRKLPRRFFTSSG